MTSAEERIRSLELAVQASEGAREEMEGRMDDILQIATSWALTDQTKVHLITNAVKDWRGDND